MQWGICPGPRAFENIIKASRLPQIKTNFSNKQVVKLVCGIQSKHNVNSSEVDWNKNVPI